MPILYLLQNIAPEERDGICNTILSGNDEQIAALVSKAIEIGAVKNAVATGRRMVREAQTQLEVLPSNRYREALSGLVNTLDAMFAQFE